MFFPSLKNELKKKLIDVVVVVEKLLKVKQNEHSYNTCITR